MNLPERRTAVSGHGPRLLSSCPLIGLLFASFRMQKPLADRLSCWVVEPFSHHKLFTTTNDICLPYRLDSNLSRTGLEKEASGVDPNRLPYTAGSDNFAALHLAASLLAGSCNFNHTGMVLITLKQVSWQAFARPLTGLTGLSTCRVLRPSFYSVSPIRQFLKDKPHQSHAHAPGEIG